MSKSKKIPPRPERPARVTCVRWALMVGSPAEATVFPTPDGRAVVFDNQEQAETVVRMLREASNSGTTDVIRSKGLTPNFWLLGMGESKWRLFQAEQPHRVLRSALEFKNLVESSGGG